MIFRRLASLLCEFNSVIVSTHLQLWFFRIIFPFISVICIYKYSSSLTPALDADRSNELKEVKMAYKTFKTIEEMAPFFNKTTNSYEFVEDGRLLDIEITFDYFNVEVDIKAEDIICFDIKVKNITAGNISAWRIIANHIKCGNIGAEDITADEINCVYVLSRDITARYINAQDINAFNITVDKIDFYAVCYARGSISCKSITGSHEKARYFSLDGEVFVDGKKQ